MSGQSKAEETTRSLSWVEVCSPAGIAAAWLWYLERESGTWLPWQTYAALVLAAVAVASLALAATTPFTKDGSPAWRGHLGWAGLSLLAAGLALAIAIPTLSASLVVSSLALSPGLLIFLLYAHSLRHGRMVLVPLEMLAALILTVACALPLAAQRGDLALADPSLLATMLAHGDFFGNTKLVTSFLIETLARILHYPPAHPFFLLFLCQRLMLARPAADGRRRAHRAGTTIPIMARIAPGLTAVALAVAVATAVTSPMPSKRLQMALTACTALLLLVADRRVRGPATRRHLALDAALVAPFLAAAVVL